MTQTHINIAMLAHVDAGKTTLSEALLYKSGSIRKAGRVDNKDAFLDTMKWREIVESQFSPNRLFFRTEDVNLHC